MNVIAQCERIESAKSDFLQAKSRLEHAIANTPNDRIAWSPASSARSPLQILVHTAHAIHMMNEMLDGRTIEIPKSEEADRYFLEYESRITSKEAALDLFEANSASYLTWLDALDDSRLEDMVKLPFGLGEAPMSFMLTMIPLHTNMHSAQIEYIQTIYGDRDWHL